jgi:elongation factor Ts
MADLQEIKNLREKTGVSLALCKKALEEGGNLEKAQELLRKWGQQLAGKRTGRATNQGVIAPYIHANGKLGVLVDLRCETDFVAKTDDFKELAHEIALHIAASNPEYISGEDVPAEMIEKEKEIYVEQMAKENKPQDIMDQIIQGKIDKFKKGICLLDQPFVKDDSKTIQDLVNEYIAKIGENITISQFARLEI